jgi:outer membrane protein
MKLKNIMMLIILTAFINISNSFCQLNGSNFKRSTDTLTLKEYIAGIMESHPSIKSSEEEIFSAESRINLAKTGYYPFVDIAGSYTRLDPVSEISIPVMGSFKFYPENNYTANLEVKETIYDFGKTKNNINKESENLNLVKIYSEQSKQRISLSAVINFFTLLYLDDAIKIKDEELFTLNEHLKYIEKKKEAGTAIEYEILTTKVKISNVENQKTDLNTARKVQLSILNSMLGDPVEKEHHFYADIENFSFVFPYDSLINISLERRNEIKISKEKRILSGMNYDLISVQDNPVISLFGTAGWKNGYTPDLNEMKANYVAGVSVNIPLFDANKTRTNLSIAESAIKEADYDIDLTRRNIRNEVIESESNLNAAVRKIEQFKLQLKQADHAYTLAEVNYKAGAITNLDLLDASTSVSESKLLLLKSKIDYIIYAYKLKSAIGEKLY